MEPRKFEQRPNPAAKANCISRLLFSWSAPLFRQGNTRTIDEHDLYDVLPADSSINLASLLRRQWEKELYASKTGQQPSLLRAMRRTFRSSYVAMIVLFLFLECLRIGQALILLQLLKYFEQSSNRDMVRAFIYAGAWCFTYLLIVAFDHIGAHNGLYTGLKMRASLTSIIYRKILRLSQTSLNETNTSEIFKLLSADANRFDQNCLATCYLFIAPLETVIILAMLWLYVDIGPTCLTALGVIALIVPLNVYLGRYLSKLKENVAVLTERRVRQIGEILVGIRTIKMNCWENAFSTLIDSVRSSENTYIRAICHYRSFNTAMNFVSGKIFVYSAFVIYILLGHNPGAAVLFASLSLFETLRVSLCEMWPWALQYSSESRKALQRIQEFLLLEERSSKEMASNAGTKGSIFPEKMVVLFENYSASWNKDVKSSDVTLKNISLSVDRGQLVVITGHNGSGKTSLLMSMLNEVPRLGGFVRSRGKLGFVPQHNWIFSATFRENIMFGLEMDSHMYNKVLYACDLVKDLDSLPYNDLTIVGEHGVSLTAGQRAKIGLARAIYQGAEVFLVDDIFSCLEDKEAVHIFTKCFCGLISKQTIIIVTQKYKFIKAADHIILLKQGEVDSTGTHNTLKKQGINFQDIVADFEEEEIKGTHIKETKPPAPPAIVSDNSKTSQGSVRQKMWLDHFYSSQENLDKIWLQFEDASDTKLLGSEEGQATPLPSTKSYIEYLKYGGGDCGMVLFFITSLFAHVSFVLCDWWLYHWSKAQHKEVIQTHRDNYTVTEPPLFSLDFTLPVEDFYIYTGLVAGAVLLSISCAAFFTCITTRTSRNLHDDMLFAVFRAPTSFFEKNSLATIWSCFGKQLCYIDDSLPSILYQVVQFQWLVLCVLVVCAIANYWMILCILITIPIMLYIRYYFIQTARQLKRLENTARSLVHEHLSNSVEGLWTVRTFAAEDRFLRYFDTYQDRHTSASYICLASHRWFAVRVDILNVLFICTLAFTSIAAKDFSDINAGVIGIALAYAMHYLGRLQLSSRLSVDVEHQMAGVNKILKYSQIRPEGPIITATRPHPLWPQYGIVTFEGVSVQYAEDSSRVIKNMWACFRAQEKVGILSRPDSSKRALLAALLRFTEPSGIIRIDGVDISELGLQDLRDRISVIPQDPALFGGSMRRNLDPHNRHPDIVLWKALEEVNLRDKVEHLPGKLYAEMLEYGSNFSLGERQLLCIARCLLRPSKVVIFEETLSIIEKRCERLIHHILCSKFENSTVITIAQRLNAIIDSDRVLVLHDGKVREFDPPHTLLQNPKGTFYKMVHSLPEQQIGVFKTIAKDKFENKPYTAPPQLSEASVPKAAVKNSRQFMPVFQTNRMNGVLHNFNVNQFFANKF